MLCGRRAVSFCTLPEPLRVMLVAQGVGRRRGAPCTKLTARDALAALLQGRSLLAICLVRDVAADRCFTRTSIDSSTRLQSQEQTSRGQHGVALAVEG
jgi:hypothetical protein